jgi:predicted DNA-binding protein (UPF0251 family)
MDRLDARTRLHAAAQAQLTLESPTGARAESGGSLQTEEHDLLRLMATGANMREAAAAMHVSPRTGARRLAAAKVKLGALTTAEAILCTVRDQTYSLEAVADVLESVDGPLGFVFLVPF